MAALNYIADDRDTGQCLTFLLRSECTSTRRSQKPRALHEIFCTCYCGRGSVLLLRQCGYVMYFRFWDDIMLSHDGANGAKSIRRSYVWSSSPGGGTGRQPRARGRSVLSPIVLCYQKTSSFMYYWPANTSPLQ